MRHTNVTPSTGLRIRVLACGLTLASLSALMGAQQLTAQGIGGGTVTTGCMLDLYEEFGQGGGLNCTANDIQVAQVININILDDGCAFPGDTVTFGFTAEVVLTAQERHDVGVYFATDGDPNADGAFTGVCSLTALSYSGTFQQPQPGGGFLTQSFVDLDLTNDDTKNSDDYGYCADVGGVFELDSFGFPKPCNEVGAAPAGDCSAGFTCQEFGAGIPGGSPFQDICGDIDSTFKTPAPGIFVDVPSLSASCLDTDGDGLLNLPNCTSWRQPGVNDLCLSPKGAFPGAPSKCRCDIGFNIPIDVPGAISAVDKITLDANGDPLPGDPTLFDFDLTGVDADLPLMFQLADADPLFGPIGLDASFCRGDGFCANSPATACTLDSDCPTYNLSETVPAGWTLVSAECVSTFGTQDLVASGGVLTVAPNEELACTFINQLASTPDLGLTKALQSNADEDGSGDVSVGDTLTYSFVAENTGNVDLTGVTITDPLPGLSALTCTPMQPATLAPAETLSCTATYVVTAADVTAGSIDNTATASSNETPDAIDSETVPVPSPFLNLVKSLQGNADEDGSGDVSVGDTLTYSFVVTNTGNTNLTNVSISDPLPGLSALTCTPMQPATLAPAATLSCTATYVVTAADVTAGSIDNTATASSDQTPDDSDSETVPVPSPGLTLTKQLTGNADEDGSGDVTAGDTLTYTFTATNSGTSNLTGVTITDPLPGLSALSCTPMQPSTLAPGASMTCTATYVVTQADVDAGQIVNTATADSDQTGPVMDPEVVPTAQTPAIDLVKDGTLDTGGDGSANPGDLINYTFQVTNIGTVTLTNVSVTDPLVSPITCPSGNPIPSLAPGVSEICTGSYAIDQADIDSGQRDNTATATGTPPSGPDVSDVDSHSEPLPIAPPANPCTGEAFIVQNINAQLTQIDQSVSPFIFVNVGIPSGTEYNAMGFRRTDGLLYAVELNSGGNTQIIRIDRDGNVFGLGRPALLPTSPRFDAGDISSDGSTMYITTVNQPLYILDLTALPTLPPVIEVVKSGASGFVFDWAYNPTNGLLYGGDSSDGQMAVLNPATGLRTDLNLVDTGLGTLPSSVSFGGSWFNVAGQLFLYRNNGEIYEIDVSVPTIVDIQTGPGSSRNDAASCIQDVIGAAKQMSVTTDGLPETLTIDYVFENISTADDLFNLSAVDDLAAVFGVHGVDWTFTSISSAPASFANPGFDGYTDFDLINRTPIQTLLNGATATVSVEIEILTLTNLDGDGNFCNQILVLAETADGTVFGDLSTDGTNPDPDGNGSPDERGLACTGFTPDEFALDLVKSLQGNADEDGSGDVSEGDTLTYGFVATNTGTSSLTGVMISDPLVGLSALSCTPAQPATLAPAATLSCTATYVVTAADVIAGVINNTATASSNEAPDATDSETVPVPGPALNLVKSLQSNADEDSSGSVTEGDTLTYSFVVTNTGTANLTGVSISDPLPGLSALSCTPAQPATLAPAATLSCTATYVVTAADATAGVINNTATASSDQTPDDSDSETVPVDQASMNLVKSLQGNADEDASGDVTQGDTLTYSFVVTNTGTVTLTNVSISDPLPGLSALTCVPAQPTALAPAATLSCTATYVVTAADVTAGVINNTATASSNETPDDSDSETVPVAGGQVPFPCSGEAYIVQNLNAELTQIDQSVAPFVFIPVGVPTGIEINNLAFRSTDGLLYGVELNASGNNQIIQIDANGTVFGLGRPAGLPSNVRFDGGDISGDGTTFYLNRSGTGTLYRVNLNTFTVTSVAIAGATGVVFDWAVSPADGLLYGGDMTNGQLANLDPATGARSDVFLVDTGLGTLPTGTSFGGAWFNATGRLFLYRNNGSIYEIDLSVPTIVDIQTGPGSVRNDAAACVQGILGAAKQMSTTTDGLPETVTIDYVFENFSLVDDLFNLSAIDDLSAVFGVPGVDWTFTSISSAPASLANPSFDGDSDIELIEQAPTQSLTAGSTATVSVQLELLTLAAADAGNNFCNQVLVTGENAGGTVFGDVSTEGSDPDPNGDGSPDERDLACINLDPAPSMSLVKSLQGNADEDGSGDVSAGDTLTYGFVVTNTGAATLTNVSISDPLPGLSALACTPAQPATLAPAATMTCTATYVVTTADVTAGQIVNTATASSDQTPDDQDTVMVPTGTPPAGSMTLVKNGILDVGSGPGAIQLVKTGSLDRGPDGESTPGDVITYTFEVTNPGPSPLTNVTLSDPLVPVVTCPSGNPIPALGVGASETCTGTYAITQADIDAGVRNNTADASGLDSGGSPVSDQDSHSETIPPPGGFQCTGEAYIIQNVNAELTQIDQSVSPFVFIPVTGPLGTEINNLGFRITDSLMYGVELSPGGNVQIVQIDPSGTVTGLGRPVGLPTSIRFDAGDVSADGTTMYINTVNRPLYVLDLSAAPVLPPVSVVNVTGASGFVFDWAASPIDGLLYGGDSTSGQLARLNPVTGVRTDFNLVDTGLGTLPSGTAFGAAWFNSAGQLFLYRNNGQIYTIDLAVPTIINVQTGPGSTRNDGAACIPPALFTGGAEKSHLPGIADPGDLINYTFEVTNTGSVVLTNVLISDPLVPVITCPSGNPIPTLGVGASETCTGSYAITQADVDAGVVNNTATVDSDQTGPVQDSDSEPIPQTPSLGLVKSGALDQGGDGVSTVGDLIDYTFQVTNLGNVTLTNVTVSDPLVATITCPGGNPIAALAPESSVTCTGSYAITQADIDAGQRDNTATADSDQAGPVQDSHSEPIPTSGGFVCGEAYLVQNVNAQLTQIDQSTSPFTLINLGPPAGIEYNNLGFRFADQMLYAVELSSSGNVQVVQIDGGGVVTGLGRPAGLPSNIRFDAGDVSPDGTTMYITTVNRPLYRLDLTGVPALPAVTSVNKTGATGFVFDWAASPIDGQLYGGDSTDSQLAILNPTTGARTDVAVQGCTPFGANCAATGLPAGTAYGGAWFNAAGRLFLFRNSGAIYEIDLNGGGAGIPRIVSTQTGPTSSRNDAASCIAPAP